MPPSYAQNKEHIYKWRLNNLEKYNSNAALHMRRYRERKKERNNIWKEIKMEFMGILII